MAEKEKKPRRSAEKAQAKAGKLEAREGKRCPLPTHYDPNP